MPLSFARLARRRPGLQGDSGFTLVESVVALVIIAIVFMAMAIAAITGVRATVGSRLNQQAADIVNRAIEQARTMDYAGLTMATGDLQTGEVSGTISGTPPQYNVPGIGLETVDNHTTGAVSPHVTSITANVNHATFTLYRYVTVPASATTDSSGFPSVKRFTAVVKWRIYGQTHTRVGSTLITDTSRGLPLPNFTLRANGPTTTTVNPGVPVDFAFAVHNLGARDSFNFTVSSDFSPLTTGWVIYLDDGYTDPAAVCSVTAAAPVAGDGIHECAETHTAGNWDAASGNTAPDTGPMDPNTDLKFVAERTTSTSDIPGGHVTFTATSTAQPAASSASHSVTYTLNVQNGAVTGGGCPAAPTSPTPSAGSGTSLVSFYMRNANPGGNTTTNIWNPLSRGDCTTQSGFDGPNWSTEVGNDNRGRYLYSGGTASATDKSLVAAWRYQPASTTTVNGNAVLTVWLQCVSSNATPTVNAAVGLTNGLSNLSTFTMKGQGSTALTSCVTSGWQKVLVSIPITSFSAKETGNNADWIGLRIWVTSGATGGSDVRLMYDWPNFVSFIVMAVNP